VTLTPIYPKLTALHTTADPNDPIFLEAFADGKAKITELTKLFGHVRFVATLGQQMQPFKDLLRIDNAQATAITNTAIEKRVTDISTGLGTGADSYLAAKVTKVLSELNSVTFDNLSQAAIQQLNNLYSEQTRIDNEHTALEGRKTKLEGELQKKDLPKETREEYERELKHLIDNKIPKNESDKTNNDTDIRNAKKAKTDNERDGGEGGRDKCGYAKKTCVYPCEVKLGTTLCKLSSLFLFFILIVVASLSLLDYLIFGLFSLWSTYTF
jgi:hypothetical protein